ncbi:MAG: transcriptional regulator, partial [Candidatus Zixiibacteriota bacterium]
MYSLVADTLGKRFGPRKVLADISFELQTNDSLAVVGDNGSGKTTLLMLLLGFHAPTRGRVVFRKGSEQLSDAEIRSCASLVSPYLCLYDNLTAEENLVFFATVSGGSITGKQLNTLLERVGLEGRGTDLAASYSSGMKQRLKYAVALLKDPAFLFLDEPMSNLD